MAGRHNGANMSGEIVGDKQSMTCAVQPHLHKLRYVATPPQVALCRQNPICINVEIDYTQGPRNRGAGGGGRAPPLGLGIDEIKI